MVSTLHGPALDRLVQETTVRKDLGLAWQRAIYADPQVVSLFGSSEIVRHARYKPQDFFAARPSGFGVSAVGRAGCTSLTLAQRLAAAFPPDSPPRHVAIILSPSWFFTPQADSSRYAFNSPPAQLGAVLCNPRLSLSLKHDFARRMLDYPEALNDAPLLRLLASEWANLGPQAKIRIAILTPLVCLEDRMVEWTDDVTIAWEVITRIGAPRRPRVNDVRQDWAALRAAVDREVTGNWNHRDDDRPHYPGDHAFLRVMRASREWEDLELLLRTTQECGLDPVLFEIPVDRRFYQGAGISEGPLDEYTSRLRDVAAHYRVSLIEFRDHEYDRAFFFDHHDHFSDKGWLYFDQALDGVFGERARERTRRQMLN